jgi:peptidyl-prolyl cis-trans isomerase-like 4
MSVLLETSLGDLTLDLYTSQAPKACLNFLKLCKLKYFNDCCFYNLLKGFTISCGDPTIRPGGHLTTPAAAGASSAAKSSAVSFPRLSVPKGGDSLFGLMYGSQARFFPSETTASLGHSKKGTVSMVPLGGKDHANTSAFFITLSDELNYLDGKHAVFARVVEGLDEFQAKLATVLVDAETGQPRQNIKVSSTTDTSALGASRPSFAVTIVLGTIFLLLSFRAHPRPSGSATSPRKASNRTPAT